MPERMKPYRLSLALLLLLAYLGVQALTGEQIAEKLTAVFGAAADRMADAAFPGIERFQKGDYTIKWLEEWLAKQNG